MSGRVDQGILVGQFGSHPVGGEVRLRCGY